MEKYNRLVESCLRFFGPQNIFKIQKNILKQKIFISDHDISKAINELLKQNVIQKSDIKEHYKIKGN